MDSSLPSTLRSRPSSDSEANSTLFSTLHQAPSTLDLAAKFPDRTLAKHAEQEGSAKAYTFKGLFKDRDSAHGRLEQKQTVAPEEDDVATVKASF